MAIVFLCECGESFEGEAIGAEAGSRCPGCGALMGVPEAGRRRWRHPRRLRAGLALVVAVVLGTVTVQVGWSRVRDGRSERCLDNLRKLGLALATYQDANGHFPAAAIAAKDGTPLLSWRVAILPELGYRALYDRFRRDEPWDSPHNRALLAEMPRVYACPSEPDRRSSSTVYHAIVGPKVSPTGVGTMFEWARGVDLREATDGTSNTLLVVETTRPVPWTRPDDEAFVPEAELPTLGSRHPRGFNVVLADGAARRVGFGVSRVVLLALITRDGGEVLGGG